jgi:hypothetical protein
MSRLTDLQQKIQDTNALIAQMERSVAGKSVPSSVLANIRSLEKRRAMLEQDFLLVADRQSRDVCSYRMFNPGERYKLSGFGKALADFQTTFSLTYDALKNGPKQRAVIPPDVEAATAFDFGYAFSGSVGVVMTLENERLLLGNTWLDETMGVVFQWAMAETSDDVAAFAKRLGPPPIRALYRWATDHVIAEMGADIQWRKERSVSGTLLLQQPELERLREAIAATSDETVDVITVTGKLIGIDTSTKRFRLELPDGEEVAGSSGDVVSEGHSVVVPSQQTARIEVKTRIHYSIDKEEKTWRLLDLREPSR